MKTGITAFKNGSQKIEVSLNSKLFYRTLVQYAGRYFFRISNFSKRSVPGVFASYGDSLKDKI